MNAGIQGLAADIFKVALVRLDEALEARGLSSRIVLQVHDEILLEAVEDEREEAIALTVETMEHAFELHVPLAVHLAVGDSWAAGKEPRARSRQRASTNWTPLTRTVPQSDIAVRAPMGGTIVKRT